MEYKVIKPFDGAKFRCTDPELVEKIDEWGHKYLKEEKQVFMTRSYKKYLLEKYRQEEENEIIKLEKKLIEDSRAGEPIDKLTYFSYSNKVIRYEQKYKTREVMRHQLIDMLKAYV